MGNSDAIVQANTFLQSIIDLGQNTILDVQSNPNGFDVIYNQPNDPGFSLVVNPSGFSGLLFLSGIQITAADLSPVNANGVQTLTLKNSGATVDSMKIIGLGNGTLDHAERWQWRVFDRKQSVHPRSDGLKNRERGEA